MRIDTKLKVLERVTQNGTFALDTQLILGNQLVKINNWKDVCVALRVLQDVDWLPDDQQNILLVDYLANRGDLDVIELPNEDYQRLAQAVARYDAGLPVVINTLRAHACSASPETVWVEIKSVSDPTELASITADIERALKIAAQAGSSFKFVGVAQGSDWLGFLPGSEVTGVALNYCIGLAASISTELLKVAGPVMNTIVRVVLDNDDRDEEPSQEEIDKQLRVIKDRATDLIIDEAVKTFTEHLERAQYPPDVQNQVGAAIRATTKTIRDLAESDRAEFEMSELGRGIVIQVQGNNNQITIQNFPDIPTHREALPPGDSE